VGPLEEAQRVLGELMIKTPSIRRKKCEDALFAGDFTEKSADGRRSQKVSLLTKAEPQPVSDVGRQGFRIFQKRNKNVRGLIGGVTVRFLSKTGLS
jgi:hypothetical protein